MINTIIQAIPQKPYYIDGDPDNPNGVVYCADCFDVLLHIPEKSVDLVLTDPPYNVGQEFANDRLTTIDYCKFMREWISESHRILKNGGAFYMCHFVFGMWEIKSILDLFDWKFLNLIVWTYPNLIPSNKRLKNRWPLSYQPIFYYGKNNNQYDLMGKIHKIQLPERTDVWTITACQSNFKDGKKRIHPTSKPGDLFKKVILASSEKQGIVLDPFLGSGTTAVACKQLSRKFIGIEIEEKYCRITKERLQGTPENLPFPKEV